MKTLPLNHMLALIQSRFSQSLGDQEISGFFIGVYSDDGNLHVCADANPHQNLAICTEMLSASVERVLEGPTRPSDATTH